MDTEVVKTSSPGIETTTAPKLIDDINKRCDELIEQAKVNREMVAQAHRQHCLGVVEAVTTQIMTELPQHAYTAMFGNREDVIYNVEYHPLIVTKWDDFDLKDADCLENLRKMNDNVWGLKLELVDAGKIKDGNTMIDLPCRIRFSGWRKPY